MAKVQFVTEEKAASVGSSSGSRGSIQSRSFFNKSSDPLLLRIDRLGVDAVLNFQPSAADTLIYVWTGAVLVRGVRLAERSSLIVEQGDVVEISASDGEAALLLFSRKEQRRAMRAERHIRLLPRERVPCNRDLGNQGLSGGALHADASDASCHLWLHENDFYVGGSPVAVHSHSEDEIIFVREGELRVGRRHYGPGAALAIAANTKYGFEVGPSGLSFVNFRAAAPTYTSHDGKQSMDEAAFWRSQTGQPHYIDLPAAQ